MRGQGLQSGALRARGEPPAGEGAARAQAAWVRRPRSCVGAPARWGRGWGSPRPYESRLLRQALTRRVRQRGSSAPVAID